jgi:hypothetical protein
MYRIITLLSCSSVCVLLKQRICNRQHFGNIRPLVPCQLRVLKLVYNMAMQSTAAESITKPLRLSYTITATKGTTWWSSTWQNIIHVHQEQRECHSHIQPTGPSHDQKYTNSPVWFISPSAGANFLLWLTIPASPLLSFMLLPPPTLNYMGPTITSQAICSHVSNRQPISGPPSFEWLTFCIRHLIIPVHVRKLQVQLNSVTQNVSREPSTESTKTKIKFNSYI